MSFQARLLYLIAYLLKIPSQRVAFSTDLRNDLELDDTDLSLMVFKLENYFEKELTEEQVSSINTVQDLERLLA